MAHKGARAGRGAGLFGGSGILALYGLACLIGAAVAGLAVALAPWLAALIVGAAVLVIAGPGRSYRQEPAEEGNTAGA